MVETGAFRRARSSETALEKEDASGNIRCADNLYMDGAKVMSFTSRGPQGLSPPARAHRTAPDAVDHVVLHQANRFMLDALQHKMAVPDAKLPRHFQNVGNTVSSTSLSCWRS
jgi:3-oxoacyl-[acyl-carrier-protein] synthase-3